MAGTPKAAPRRAVLTEQNPSGAVQADNAFDLTGEFAVDPQPPQTIRLFDGTYSVRRDLSGDEVLEFSRMLRYKPKRLPDTDDGQPGGLDEDDWNRHMAERVGFLLAEGDPVALWSDIKDQNLGVADRMLNRIYAIAGLLDAEGNFRAL